MVIEKGEERGKKRNEKKPSKVNAKKQIAKEGVNSSFTVHFEQFSSLPLCEQVTLFNLIMLFLNIFINNNSHVNIRLLTYCKDVKYAKVEDV